MHNLKTSLNHNSVTVYWESLLDAIKARVAACSRADPPAGVIFIGLYLYPLLFQSSLNPNQSFPKGETGLAWWAFNAFNS